MKKNIYTNLVGALTIAAVIAGCSSSSKDKPTQLKELKEQQAKLNSEIKKLEDQIAEETPDSVRSARVKEVVVASLAPRKFDHYVQTQGAVESDLNIQVSAKTPGVITNVLVREGEMVAKGQTLAQIDNTLILAGIAELKSQLELATTVYNRQKNLWDQKIGTEVQFLQAKSTKESLERRLASLNEQNEMTKIKAPVSGVVDALDVRIGQNIAPGMPAARIVNNSDLKIMARISESYANQLKKGNKVTVNFPDVNKEVNSSIAFVARNIDPLTRTFIVEADLPSNPELRPNMTGVVKVVFESNPKALVVPINIVQNVNNEKVVYVAEAKGSGFVARKKVVTLGSVYDNQAEVEGLAAGDKLITVGYQGLSDGEAIKI